MDPQSRERLSALALALAAGLCLAWPPEVYPASGIGAGFLLALGFLVSPRSLPLLPLLLGLALVVFNLVSSFAPGRGIEVATRLGLGVLAFALATRVARGHRGAVFWALALVGACLGGHALAQSLWLLDEAALAARAAALPEVFALRLEQGRPFATHVVPAALGGALVLSAAAALAAFLVAQARLLKGLALALALLSLLGLLLTLSIGVFGGALGGLVLLGLARGKELPRRALVSGAAILLVASVGFAILRPEVTLGLQNDDNPLALRVGNWRGAALSATHAPVSGIGLGAFRSLYPSYRRAGDSETAYAHNSWLQLSAEGGLPMLVLLAAGGWAFWRRRRETLGREELVLYAAAGAFIVHNLVDFTAYLPGVLVPAAALCGLLFARERGPDEGRFDARAAYALLAATLALVFLAEAPGRSMRASLYQPRAPGEDAERMRVAALDAGTRCTWSSAILLDAARALQASHRGAEGADSALLADARRFVERARRLDPSSPEPYHVEGDLKLASRDLAGAWEAYARALMRHPVDTELREKRDRTESALERAGLLALPLPPGSGARPLLHPWTGWDDILVIVGLGLVAPLVYRRWRGGPAPPESLTLGLLLLVAIWGEGGALPGVRFAWGLLVVVALLLALYPRPENAGREGPSLPVAPLLWLGPALAAGALAAALSPDRAAARDGLVVGLLLFVVLLLSYGLSRRYASWLRTLSGVVVAVSGGAALFWMVQRALRFFGVALEALPAPLYVREGGPLAGDFLHPGHLGTLLVAAALLVLVPRLMRGGRAAWLGWAGGALLLALGVSGGARATLLGLFAALALGSLLSLPPRLRRALLVVLIVGGLLGGAALAWRFTSADDPYAWSRVRIWGASLEALSERPWTGYGPSAFASRAPAFAPEEGTGIARFGKLFRTPHSDLLGSLLALGIPGALLLWLGLGRLLARALAGARARVGEDAAPAAALLAITVLAAHGLVDDILVERPVIGLVAALLLGAAAGRAAPDGEDLRLGRGLRASLALAALVLLASGVFAPWVADRALREGAPRLAARLDPARWSHWSRAGDAAVEAELPRRLAISLDATGRALDLAPSLAAAWRARARALDAACSGPLPGTATCGEARRAWQRAHALEPVDVFSLRARARLDARLGAAERAREGFEEALEIEPNFLGARYDLARVLDELGEHESAARQREEFLARARELSGREVQSARESALVSLRGLRLGAPPEDNRAEKPERDRESPATP